MLPVILGALAVGGGITKAIMGNQTKQRNKGYIEKSYQSSKRHLQTRQEQVRQSTTEELGARGLGQGGLSPIARTMAGGLAGHREYNPALGGMARLRDKATVDVWNKVHDHDVAPAAAPGSAHTLGEQLQVDNDKQFQLEQRDLEDSRDRAERENKAEYMNTLVSAGVGAVQGVVGAVGAAGDLGAMKGGGASTTVPTPASSSIRGTMLSGIEDPGKWWGGIMGGNPLNAEGSSWNRNQTVSGNGLTNDLFHG